MSTITIQQSSNTSMSMVTDDLRVQEFLEQKSGLQFGYNLYDYKLSLASLKR